MKIFFLIILMLALPLQISWAAMSTYCQHESGKAANHFGHHTHEHQLQKDDTKKEGSLSNIDRDCAYCHLNHVSFFSFLSDSLPLLSAHSHITDYDYNATFNLPDPPERPNWIFAA